MAELISAAEARRRSLLNHKRSDIYYRIIEAIEESIAEGETECKVHGDELSYEDARLLHDSGYDLQHHPAREGSHPIYYQSAYYTISW